jgi:hypothetical protein
MKNKIIKQIKKGKKIDLGMKETEEIVRKLLDEGRIMGYDPIYRKNKYRWIGD